jgi:methionyl-tRNA formyltransferase
MAARFVRRRLLSTVPPRLQPRLTGRYHGVRSVARAHGVPVRAVPDLRAPSFVRWVREVDPDVVLSVMCGQRIPGAVLSVPAYALNLHGSLLPRYRGRATAFWALHGEEDETGVTAHLMTEELDAGPIVERRAFPIASDDTVHDVMTGIVEHGGTLAGDLLDGLRAGEPLETVPNPTTEADYHTLPGPAARREFRRRGGEFL